MKNKINKIRYEIHFLRKKNNKMLYLCLYNRTIYLRKSFLNNIILLFYRIMLYFTPVQLKAR